MKVFFFDIDGTLAEGLEVPLSAAGAIKQIREDGNLVFICTGRPVDYVKKNFGDYCDGSICFNGRYAELKGEELYDAPLSDDIVGELVKRLDELEAGYTFYNNGQSFSGGYRDSEYESLNLQGQLVYNFNLYFKSFEHFEVIKEKMNDICIFNPHGAALSADATIKGSDKGIAIKEVLRKLQIELNDSYAFGDGANDVSMLKAVGHGICMGNGLESTKEVSEYVTTAIDNDGVYNALVHYGFIK